jgi:hypothetical protein
VKEREMQFNGLLAKTNRPPRIGERERDATGRAAAAAL